ncbi:MAG TPA: type II toxin-antitoxin system HicB family antitoxin, partial [Firmicutes bacterium]|nr:type II toxin-antitoxin system HicB family antitoxin [Bacillota bacterium]
TVTVPALPGCVTQGRTVEESLERVREAITGYLKAMKLHGFHKFLAPVLLSRGQGRIPSSS